ncbi:MAG: transglycosylase SLT domain-containing protein [Anaerolineae bacterium]|nr:transglycosylase SLT domain-containing protein [Anaerolineae bacterium]
MCSKHWGKVIFAFLALAMLLPVHPADANLAVTGLSSYWTDAVRQWEDIVLDESARRGIDPDLVASLIWKESRGRSYERGPAGAVGLMMLMPREAGFTWRPTAAELLDPAVNVFWGTRTMSIVIDQSGGDLYSALAAYNGGWGQIQYRGPRNFANDILNDYARAVAVRNGLSSEGHWVATIAPLDGSGVMTVVGPRRDLVRYSRPPVMADIPDCTTEGAPTALAFSSSEMSFSSWVGIWITLDGEVVRGASQPGDAARSDVPAGTAWAAAFSE